MRGHVPFFSGHIVLEATSPELRNNHVELVRRRNIESVECILDIRTHERRPRSLASPSKKYLLVILNSASNEQAAFLFAYACKNNSILHN